MLYARIENLKGLGPWAGGASPAAKQFVGQHNPPWVDGINAVPDGWIHAWKSLDVMKQFIRPTDCVALASEGFHVVLVAPFEMTEEYILIGKEHQVVLNPDKLRKGPIPMSLPNFYGTFLS